MNMTDDQDSGCFEFAGVKTLCIHARTRYPIVSAYEFEFLKTEKEVQELLRPCTIYFILQRPLLYFQNVVFRDGRIYFDIADARAGKPLRCSFEPAENNFGDPGDVLEIEVQFYKKDRDEKQPYNDVAALKFRTIESKFLGWLSPAKFLYEVMSGSINAKVSGDISKFVDYNVHYIGKAFSQAVWNRLTGHEKMQSILTQEKELSSNPAARAPFEISLLLLDIDGYDELIFLPYDDGCAYLLGSNVDPIIHSLSSDKSIDEFRRPSLPTRAVELTNEAEAFLISTYRPKYNSIMYENYPKIQSGTRSAGYSAANLMIELLPAILTTEHYRNTKGFNGSTPADGV